MRKIDKSFLEYESIGSKLCLQSQGSKGVKRNVQSCKFPISKLFRDVRAVVTVK